MWPRNLPLKRQAVQPQHRTVQQPKGAIREMPFYENIFIARQDVSTAQVEALTEQFVAIIDAQGGKVTKREYWGLKSLAYRVKKNRKGHYTLLNIDAPAAAVIEMERQMHLHEDVLRHLTVKVEEL